jgi:hypothetical protein
MSRRKGRGNVWRGLETESKRCAFAAKGETQSDEETEGKFQTGLGLGYSVLSSILSSVRMISEMIRFASHTSNFRGDTRAI